MTWPWSRPHPMAEHAAALRLMLEQERDRTWELTQTIIGMQRDGWRHPAAAPPATDFVGNTPDDLAAIDLSAAVEGAIAQRANRGTPEWAHLEREALSLLQAGKEPTDVAQEILAGDDPTDYLD